MGYGVIGSPPDSGSVSLGSSPSTPAQRIRLSCAGLVIFTSSLRATARAPLCSGLARRPLKAVARVRIPSGLQGERPSQMRFRLGRLAFLTFGIPHKIPHQRGIPRNRGRASQLHGVCDDVEPVAEQVAV